MRPTTATIDLPALRHNLDVARRHAPRSKAFAVIKANAYGHGVERAARAFAEADGFALVELDAAVRLREAGYRQRIALLEGYFEACELEPIVEHGIATAIHTHEQLDMLADLPDGANLDVLVKVNTGMNRLGFQPGEVPRVLARLREHGGVDAITLMTHFANADDAPGIGPALDTFEGIARDGDYERSAANSATVMRFPEAHGDWIRPGIMLYGCSPFADRIGGEIGLKPAMTLESELIAVRELAPGDSVGYGSVFTADARTRVGVVACGYADGYPRHAPTGTPVRVADRLTRTLGRVSMDMLCVDLSGIDNARVGTRVVLWGEGNPVEHVAAAAGTVGYELLCALAPRVRIVEHG